MSVIDRTTAQTAADVIADETAPNANTAARVGGLLRNFADSMSFGSVVASYYDPSNTDLSAVAELNGIFYTVPSGQGGLYTLSATFTTPGAHAIGIDSATINVWLNAEPSLDAPRLPGFSLGPGGEGTQVTQETPPASLLLKDGDTVRLSSYSGGTVSVLVRLERIALATEL